MRPWPWFFGPYYALAVASLFAHIGCAVYWNLGGTRIAWRALILSVFAGSGICLPVLIDLSLAGKLGLIDIPPTYRATYSAVWNFYSQPGPAALDRRWAQGNG